MKLTLLLDLDDTLLLNHMDTFLPAYLKALSGAMTHMSPADELIRVLLSSTQKMLEKNLPAGSLESTFDQAFYPAFGTTKTAMQDSIDQFYAHVYPSLQPLTSVRPGSVELIDFAFQRGYDVVIATNPLFPATAIEQRLRWAGIPPEKYSYALITSYHKFHFAKPNPAYYAEILGQLGWPNQPAVMVGNEIGDDILPPSLLELPVYWVDETAPPLPAEAHPLSASGSFDHVIAWLQKIEVECEQPQIVVEHVAGLMGILRSTPAALETLTQGLTHQQWTDSPQQGEWSLTEILCHLRDVDREVNLPRIQKIKAEPNVLIAGQETDNWAAERNYAAQDGSKALQEFMMVRSEIIQLLDTFPAEIWQRKAQHTIFGPTTLQEMVSFVTTHDRNHLQQLTSTLAAINSERQ